jgi:hypothetical protein
MKRLICCALIVALAGCIPIGFSARNTGLVSPPLQTQPSTPAA